MIPMSGSILGLAMPTRMPAAAASAEPPTKVRLMIWSAGMPMRLAASRLNETARMALPARVCSTRCRSAAMRKSATPMMISWFEPTMSPPRWTARAGRICGKYLGSAPKTSSPPFSSSSETPIAVISAVSRDADGAWCACRSASIPTIPPARNPATPAATAASPCRCRNAPLAEAKRAAPTIMYATRREPRRSSR